MTSSCSWYLFKKNCWVKQNPKRLIIMADNYETIVTIPNCSITHVINPSTAIPLTTGDLTLTKYSTAASNVPSAPAAVDLQAPTTNTSKFTEAVNSETPLPTVSDSASKPIFTLQVDQMAFPLLKSTVFGTDANSMRRYMFVPDLGPAGQTAQGGYVRLDLPESAIEPISADGKTTQQDQFEQALVEEGLLKEGWQAIGEDIAKGVKETVDKVRDRVTQALSTDTGRTPPEAIGPQ